MGVLHSLRYVATLDGCATMQRGAGVQLRSWAGCRWRHLVRGYGQRTDVSEAMSPIAMGSLS